MILGLFRVSYSKYYFNKYVMFTALLYLYCFRSYNYYSRDGFIPRQPFLRPLILVDKLITKKVLN